MADSSTSSDKRLARRYGNTSRNLSGRLIVIGIIALLVITGAYIFVQMTRVTTANVTASQAGWSREKGKEDQVFIFTLDVTRENPEQDSYCILTALNYDVAEVGRRAVFVPGGTEKVVRMDVPIATRELAVAGKVYGCSTEIPAYLKPSVTSPS